MAGACRVLLPPGPAPPPAPGAGTCSDGLPLVAPVLGAVLLATLLLVAVRRRRPKEPDVTLPAPAYDLDLWVASCRFFDRRRLVFGGERFLAEPRLILFRPDLRIFCGKGAYGGGWGRKCKSKPCRQDLHVSARQWLGSAQASVDAPPPASPSSCPPVPFALDVGGLGCDFAGMPRRSPAESLRNRDVVVFVHGFRQNSVKILELSRHLQQHLKRADADQKNSAPESAAIVGFQWPSVSGGNLYAKLAYTAARRNVKPAALRLRMLLNELSGVGCNVTIVAHSLGARVCLEALSEKPSFEEVLKNRFTWLGLLSCWRRDECGAWAGELPQPSRCRGVVLCAAALQHDCFSESGRYPRSGVRAAFLTSFIARGDKILQKTYNAGEHLYRFLYPNSTMQRGAKHLALGCSSREASASVDNATFLDVSAEVGEHGFERYLESKQVMDQIANAVYGKQ